MLVPSASLPLIAFNGGHDAVALLCLRRALQLYSTESCGYLFHRSEAMVHVESCGPQQS